MNNHQFKQVCKMNNKHKEKVKLALELINKKGLSAQRAAETMGVTVKEIERITNNE